MTQPDRGDIYIPQPETIPGGIKSLASRLTLSAEKHDHALNPKLGRSIAWRQQIIGGEEVVIKGYWRGETGQELFTVSGDFRRPVERMAINVSSPCDPAVTRALTDMLIEDTRKRVADGFPKK